VPLKISDRGNGCGISEDWPVVFAVIYTVVGRLLSLIVVRGRGEASKDIELVWLRHNSHRPHQSLGQASPTPRPPQAQRDRFIRRHHETASNERRCSAGSSPSIAMPSEHDSGRRDHSR
jgi:hypothetical protein